MPVYRNFGRITFKKTAIGNDRRKTGAKIPRSLSKRGQFFPLLLFLVYQKRNFYYGLFPIQPEYSARRWQHMCSRCVFLSLSSPGDVINNSIFDIIATACYKKRTPIYTIQKHMKSHTGRAADWGLMKVPPQLVLLLL